MKLKQADAELLNNLQTLWLVILLIYLVSITLFLFCVLLCTISETTSATMAVRRLATEQIERPTAAAPDHPTVERRVPPGYAAQLPRRYPGDPWLWLASNAQQMQQVQRRRQTGISTQDFDEFPHFTFKSVVKHQQQGNGSPGSQRAKSVFPIGDFLQTRIDVESANEVSSGLASVVESRTLSTTLPESVLPSAGPPLRAGEAPEGCLRPAEGEEMNFEEGEPIRVEEGRDGAPPSSSLDRHSQPLQSFQSEAQHQMSLESPRVRPQVSEEHQLNEFTAPIDGQQHPEETGHNQPHDVVVVSIEQPQSSRAREEMSTELPVSTDVNISIPSEFGTTSSSAPPIQTFATPSRRPPQVTRWERRRTIEGRPPHGRDPRDLSYLYQRAYTVPADNSTFQTTTAAVPSTVSEASSIPPADSRQEPQERHPYITHHLHLYHFFLIFVYSLVTITDVRSPPDCCTRSPEAEIDDYLDSAIFNLIVCCGPPAPRTSLLSGFTRFLRVSVFQRIYNCLFCREAEEAEGLQRHLSKKDKEALVQDAFRTTNEKLTLCCICFNDFDLSDVLVVVPCRYRHYFHRSCAQTCKRRQFCFISICANTLKEMGRR